MRNCRVGASGFRRHLGSSEPRGVIHGNLVSIAARQAFNAEYPNARILTMGRGDDDYP
jgi:hypothetical protein